MSISPISGNTLSPSVTSAVVTPQTTAPKKTAETQSPHYTVKLTGTALAKSLKLAGQNPAQIALKMGLDIKTVDSYLGVKVQTATAAPLPPPVATPTPAPAAKQAAETAQGKK